MPPRCAQQIRLPEAVISASRCELSAVSSLSSSGRIAVRLSAPSVTLPSVSVAEFSRWIVPRVLTEVVETSMPSCAMVRPASVMSPCWLKIRPEFVTR